MKESLNKLYNNGEFERIIEEYKDTSIYEEMIYVISSYISIDKIGEAYSYYKERCEFLETNDFISSVNVLFLILALLDKDYLVEKEFERLRNEPYRNYGVELYLKDLEKNYQAVKATTMDSSEQTINFMDELNSGNYERIIDAINYLKENYSKNFNTFAPLFYECYQNREEFDSIKNFFLKLLIETGYDVNLTFVKNSKFYMVNPSELKEEYDSLLYHLLDLFNIVKRNEKHVGFIKYIEGFVIDYISYNLPDFPEYSEVNTIVYMVILNIYKIHGVNIKECSYLKEIVFDETFIKNIEITLNKMMGL